MKCATTPEQRLEIETAKAIYQIQFGQIQMEITGRCNMSCQHCRAASEVPLDMPLEQIIKIVQFAKRYSPGYKEIIVSGGEPVLHQQFSTVMKEIKENGGESITLTTNGSLFTDLHLNLLEELAFQKCTLSVSLDSIKSEEHDAFRRFPCAYKKALAAIKLITRRCIPNVISSARMTLKPKQIGEMEKMANFVFDLGCNRVSFSGIHPSGEARKHPELWMNKKEKQQFVESIMNLRKKFPREFKIETNDPLFCLVRNKADIGNGNQILFDGCGAGAITFNVGANGDMTPCALLNIPMMNIFSLSIDQIAAAYQKNTFVQNMLDMNLTGKCGDCEKKYQCGGCRARAYARNGDCFAEDPDCWL